MVILQGLGVGPGSATERWPCRKNARKSAFFSKKIKLPKKIQIFTYGRFPEEGEKRKKKRKKK